jgi:hypothetical protein
VGTLDARAGEEAGYTEEMLDSVAGETTSAEALGQADAEAFDRRLRDVESSERQERLSGSVQQEGRTTEYQPALDVGRLRARMEELVAFRNAVQESFVWRAAQTVRRWFGRQW